MRRTLMWALALLVLVPAAWALDDAKDKPKPDKKQTPAEEFRSLKKEFQEKEQAALTAYRAAKTNEDRQNALAQRPKAPNYIKRINELVQDNPKEAFIPEALVWLVQRTGNSPDGKKALERLLTDHLESKEIGPICSLLRFLSRQPEQTLRKILEKNSHREVQGPASLALGQYLKGQTEGQNVTPADREKWAQEAETLLQRVVDKYADLQGSRENLGDAAKRDLFELRNLAIGKVAPEIEGEDIDGQKFKLSDYRGKVVVLDFWGHW